MTSATGVGNSSTAGALSSQTNGNVMGKEDFLRLLVAQLENQDPLNPADPTEFTAQLAQFSSLEQLFGVNETLEEMAAATSGLEGFSALSFIGREVVAAGEEFSLGEEGVDLGFRLEETAAEVELQIQDQGGRTVAVLEAGAQEPGEYFVHWDGTDGSGGTVSPGEYRFVVRALGDGEETVAADPMVKGVVNGVDFDGNESWLVTTAGDFKVSQVTGAREVQP